MKKTVYAGDTADDNKINGLSLSDYLEYKKVLDKKPMQPYNCLKCGKLVLNNDLWKDKLCYNCYNQKK